MYIIVCTDNMYRYVICIYIYLLLYISLSNHSFFAGYLAACARWRDNSKKRRTALAESKRSSCHRCEALSVVNKLWKDPPFLMGKSPFLL